MTDLERQAHEVWSPDVRQLVDEAIRCYNAGAIRAAITTVWTAVIADLIDKIVYLADGGDADAAAFRDAVDKARAHGITPAGVRAMQQIEDKLLVEAEKFELIDSIGARELNRIREDRNLCVHPSLRHLGETYDPRPEMARGHLAIALTTVLVHPPTQGRKALDDFAAYVSNSHFVASARHLLATFFDRLRRGTRTNILKVAAKHALCEVAPPAHVSVTATVLADRMAQTITVFARRDRDLVRSTVRTVYPRFEATPVDIQLRAVARLGDQDFFWDTIQPPLAEHLDGSIAAITMPGEYEPLPVETATLFALVRDPAARVHLPGLQSRFRVLSWRHRLDVAAVQPDPYFLPMVIEYVRGALSYRIAEQVGESLVLPHSRYLSVETLSELLEGWASNDQCVNASGMPSVAVEMFTATAHLGAARYPVWRVFVDKVSAGVERGSWYSYSEVDAALTQAAQ